MLDHGDVIFIFSTTEGPAMGFTFSLNRSLQQIRLFSFFVEQWRLLHSSDAFCQLILRNV
jgi:hypothetical protein